MQEKLALGDGAGVGVVGTDPPELAVEARRRARTVVAGTGPEADVRPDTAELDDGGHPRLTWRGHTVTLPVVGFHQIENALIALAVGREVGADPARAVAALAGVRLPGGRGAMLELGGLTVIDDTYNANSGSLHWRSEEHTSELQSQSNLVCRLLLEKKRRNISHTMHRAATLSDARC